MKFWILLLLLAIMSEAAAQEPRIVLVVDNSGSMSGRAKERAVELVNEIVEQPTDGLDVAIIVFSTGWYWLASDTGMWYHLPSQEALEEIKDRLSLLPPEGLTHVVRPMEVALNDETRADVIVLISDGNFNQEQLDRLKEMVDNRVILVPVGDDRTNMVQLAEETQAQLEEP